MGWGELGCLPWPGALPRGSRHLPLDIGSPALPRPAWSQCEGTPKPERCRAGLRSSQERQTPEGTLPSWSSREVEAWRSWGPSWAIPSTLVSPENCLDAAAHLISCSSLPVTLWAHQVPPDTHTLFLGPHSLPLPGIGIHSPLGITDTHLGHLVSQLPPAPLLLLGLLGAGFSCSLCSLTGPAFPSLHSCYGLTTPSCPQPRSDTQAAQPPCSPAPCSPS